MNSISPTNGTRTSPAAASKFQIRSTAETLEELQKPIDPRHFRTRKQGKKCKQNPSPCYRRWALVGFERKSFNFPLDS